MHTTRPQRGCRSPHGTNARYTAGCSCFDCCDAHAAYQRARGPKTTKTNVPVSVVAAHVRKLKAKGMSRRAITEMSGVSYKTLRNIDDGAYENVIADTAAALLALTGPLRSSDSTALISAWWTIRDIARAGRRGISRADIAAELGIARKSLPPKGQARIQAATAKRIREAIEKIKAERRAA